MNLLVVVLHYNRPDYLDNCLASLERNLPGVPILVMDDSSDQPAAVERLNKLSDRYEVIVSGGQTRREDRTGGLHANMTRALAIARERGYEIVLMVQEDMQIVRPMSQRDRSAIMEAFARPDASFVLRCTFRQGKNRQRYKTAGRFRRATPEVFERARVGVEEDGLCSYADVGFFHVGLFDAQMGELKTGEMQNEAFLRRRGLRMGWLELPMMHWLPFPVSFRSRRRQFKRRAFDWLAGAGLHPIDDMRPQDLRALLEARLEGPPFAEDWLGSPTCGDCAYWSLAGGRSNLIARGGWRARLSRIL